MAGSDAAVRRELLWVTAWTAGLTLLMHLVFLALGRWDLPVLWGSLLGAGTAVGNFWLLCRMVERAVGRDEKEAKNVVRASQSLRLLMQGAVLVLAFLLRDVFNPLAAALPLFFPQLAVFLRPLWKKGMGGKESAGGDPLE